MARLAILSLLPTLLVLTITAHAKTASAAVAPGPTPAPLNLTGILEKGGQYTTLLRLMKTTQVGTQIESQLNNSFNGMTIFAPTDNAFNNLKPGTLNSLSAQEQVALVLYHVLPRFYSLSTFETTSNPVSTQASDKSGVYTMNITSTSNQVNVSTGVIETQVNNALYSDFPLAVYSVDKVLLPNALFGPKPPAAAPMPAEPVAKKGKPENVPAAKGPAAEAADSTTPSAAVGGLRLDLGLAAGLGLVFAGLMF